MKEKGVHSGLKGADQAASTGYISLGNGGRAPRHLMLACLSLHSIAS